MNNTRTYNEYTMNITLVENENIKVIVSHSNLTYDGKFTSLKVNIAKTSITLTDLQELYDLLVVLPLTIVPKLGSIIVRVGDTLSYMEFELEPVIVKDEPIYEKDGSQAWYNKDGKRHRDNDMPAWIWKDGTNGKQCWYKDGERHREGDEPAIICANGQQEWYKDGKCHREGDLPAYINPNGKQCWYKDGNCHREGDLPAFIWSDGSQDWFKDGKLHREGDLPARIDTDGTKQWYKDGKCHRDNDMPAWILEDGSQFWYKEGVKYTPDYVALKEKYDTLQSKYEKLLSTINQIVNDAK